MLPRMKILVRWGLLAAALLLVAHLYSGVSVASFTTAADTAYLVQVHIIGRCTANCATVGTGAGGQIVARFRRVGGTVTEIGADVGTFAEDTDGTHTFAITASGTAIEARITTTGDADINLVWHTTMRVWRVSS